MPTKKKKQTAKKTKAVKKRKAVKGRGGNLAGQIRTEMLRILRSNSEGLRLKDLVQRIQKALPKSNEKQIRGTIWFFAQRESQAQDEGRTPKFYQPEQGIYCSSDEDTNGGQQAVKESELYDQVARYMVDELNECNNAIGLGGKGFGDRWGTPDAIGIMRRLPGNVIDFQTEIVSAEIKAKATQLVEGFGQACAYRLFSHKVYLVAPAAITPLDLQRLEALCLVSGIGLILFSPDRQGKNRKEQRAVTFNIRTRAVKGSPSMFYANKYLQKVANDLLKF